MYSNKIIGEVLAGYGIDFERTLKEPLPGSPQRCIYRIVAEGKEGRKYFLEALPAGSLEHKQKIIDTLHHLNDEGLGCINLYMKAKDGSYITDHAGDYWQVQAYIENDALDQKVFFNDSWRGEALADFLIKLKEKTFLGVPSFDQAKPHSIKRYVKVLAGNISKSRPNIYDKIFLVLRFLEKDFFKAYDSLTLGFSHGDYHPVNIMWGEKRLNAVIDWEFLGYNPEMYDAANMLGCVGMENPVALARPLAVSFLSRLKKAGIYEEASWRYLLDLVIALRFAWLSEWLRNKDDEMIELEIAYMHLLMKNKDVIMEGWRGL